MYVSIFYYSLSAIISAFTAPAYSSADEKQVTTTDCEKSAGQPLKFWSGRWNVFVDGKLDGKSFIEPTLKGCAVLEHWDDESGYKGMSLFYFEPHDRTWKQVWVTEQAMSPSGVKEKELREFGPDYARFEGTVWAASGEEKRDRTTLTRLNTGEVTQIVEVSADDGKTWRKVYDATYRRSAPHSTKGKSKESLK
jgi:hypothetical protein